MKKKCSHFLFSSWIWIIVILCGKIIIFLSLLFSSSVKWSEISARFQLALNVTRVHAARAKIILSKIIAIFLSCSPRWLGVHVALAEQERKEAANEGRMQCCSIYRGGAKLWRAPYTEWERKQVTWIRPNKLPVPRQREKENGGVRTQPQRMI